MIKEELKLNIISSRLRQEKIKTLAIRFFKNEKGTGVVRYTTVSGIVTGDASFSYWPIFSPSHLSAQFLLVAKELHSVLKCL